MCVPYPTESDVVLKWVRKWRPEQSAWLVIARHAPYTRRELLLLELERRLLLRLDRLVDRRDDFRLRLYRLDPVCREEELEDDDEPSRAQ